MVELYRFVEGEWAYWGHYDLTVQADIDAYTSAVAMFAIDGYQVKGVKK